MCFLSFYLFYFVLVDFVVVVLWFYRPYNGSIFKFDPALMLVLKRYLYSILLSTNNMIN